MAYNPQDFDNPVLLFEARTRQVRARIQTLENDLIAAKHPITKALISTELHNRVDNYVERKSVLRGTQSTGKESDE